MIPLPRKNTAEEITQEDLPHHSILHLLAKYPIQMKFTRNIV